MKFLEKNISSCVRTHEEMYFKKYLLGPQKPCACPSPVAALLFPKDNRNSAFFVLLHDTELYK